MMKDWQSQIFPLYNTKTPVFYLVRLLFLLNNEDIIRTIKEEFKYSITLGGCNVTVKKPNYNSSIKTRTKAHIRLTFNSSSSKRLIRKLT